MSDKPKIDYSKLGEYSMPPVPPVQNAPTGRNENLFDVLQSPPKTRATSKKVRKVSVNTLFLGVISFLLACIAIPIVYWSYMAYATSHAIARGIEMGHQMAESPNAKLNSGTYGQGFASTQFTDTHVFKLQLSVMNTGNKPIASIMIKTRTIKPGRSVAEYTARDCFEQIPGGINPGETKIVACSVPSESLNGDRMMYSHLPAGAVLQASTGNEKWVELVPTFKQDKNYKPKTAADFLPDLMNAKVPQPK